MIVTPLKHINMQRDPRVLRPALQSVMDHLGAQLADLLAREVEAADEVGARGDVEDCAREGFVEGSIGGAEAGDAGAWTEGAVEGGAEGEEGVFCCVMVVDWG